MNYYIVKYSGPFGFIKPWTAVRDSETFSQQFLTPSIVEGIEKKLFPELLSEQGIKKIVGHRLSYEQINGQQEVIQTRGWNSKKQGKQFLFERPTAVLTRGVLLNPTLYLAFTSVEDSQKAFTQHICLCRNEDVLLPELVEEIDHGSFNTDIEKYAGYELVFEKNDNSFMVGYNRQNGTPMYGWLKTIGNPVKNY
jgi:hypothetical protein